MLTRTIAILVASAFTAPAIAQHTSTNTETIIKTTVSVVDKYHLHKPTIDEQFCGRWLTNYMETLDPAKRYFLAEDISEFQTYVTKLPKFASTGNSEFLTLVSERYQLRVQSALEYALKRIEGEFDFSIDEQIPLHYDNWATANDDRIERWRLQLKYELLVEHSHSSETNDAIEFLKSRYESIRDQTDGISEQRAIGLYLDSFCRTVDPRSGYLTPKEFSSFSGGMLKEYSIGLYTTSTNGRAIIQGVAPEFRREPAASKILGCELLAIRSQNGDIYNFREIFPSTSHHLVSVGLQQDASVKLELYDEVRKHRFAVNWPRK